MDETDVVVVGAGLAGLECAEGLAARGVRTLLVDAKADLRTGVRTTGIFVRRTLEDFLLPADCLGPAVRRVALHGPRGHLLTLESPHDEFRVGRMARLYGRGLDRCLAKGVGWRPSTRLVGIEPTDAGSIASLTSHGRTTRVAARFVIGADGARSRVAAALGLDQNHEWIVGVEDVFTGVRCPEAPVFHCFLDARIAPGYLAWLVDDGEEVHVGVGGYAHLFQPRAALHELERRVRGFVDLDRGRRIERRGGRIPVNGILPHIVTARGLVVGDAAGAVSPLTAGGLDPCLRQSRLAVEVVDQFLATGEPVALAAYAGAPIRTKFASRLWMRRMLAAASRPALMDLACRALGSAPGQALARHVFFGRKGSFPDVDATAEPAIVAPR